MPEDRKNERARGGEVETETGERLKGPKPLNLPHGNQQQQGGAPSAKQQGGQQVSKGQKQQSGQGDERTPEQPIGEVAYANRDPAKKKTGEF